MRRLSLVELIVLLVVMAMVAMVLLPMLARSRVRVAPVKCVTNLKNVGLAFRIFATDNNGLFPTALMMSNRLEMTKIDAVNVFRTLSNELSTPFILYCRGDLNRTSGKTPINFDTMTAENISYFVSLTASETNPATFLAGDRNLMTNGKAVGPGLFALTTNRGLGWTKEIHVEQGNITMADGSVQLMSSARLRQAVGAQEVGTNYLSIP